jgi:hypothetical protein
MHTWIPMLSGKGPSKPEITTRTSPTTKGGGSVISIAICLSMRNQAITDPCWPVPIGFIYTDGDLSLSPDPPPANESKGRENRVPRPREKGRENHQQVDRSTPRVCCLSRGQMSGLGTSTIFKTKVFLELKFHFVSLLEWQFVLGQFKLKRY